MEQKPSESKSPSSPWNTLGKVVGGIIAGSGICLCLILVGVIAFGNDRQQAETPEADLPAQRSQQVVMATAPPAEATSTPIPDKTPTSTDVPTPTQTPQPPTVAPPTAVPTIAPTLTPLLASTPTRVATATSTSAPVSSPSPTKPSAAGIFAGMTPAPYMDAVMMVQDWENKALEDQTITVKLATLVTDTVAYRPYYVSGQTPSNFNQAICPTPFQTIWYTYEATGNGSMIIDYGFDVTLQGIEDFAHFFSVDSGELLLTDAPLFEVSSPTYIVFCSNPQDTHNYSSFIYSPTPGRTLSCKISIADETLRVMGDEDSNAGSSVGCLAFDPDGSGASPVKTAPDSIQLAPTANRSGNLRSGPGTSFPIAGSIQAGAALDVVATNSAGDWLQLASGAWIAKFLVDNAPSNLPLAATIPVLPKQPAPVAPTTTSVPQPYAECDCSVNLYNCDDFTSPYDAQACFNFCGGVANDVHDLDRDGDGNACEWEPW